MMQLSWENKAEVLVQRIIQPHMKLWRGVKRQILVRLIPRTQYLDHIVCHASSLDSPAQTHQFSLSRIHRFILIPARLLPIATIIAASLIFFVPMQRFIQNAHCHG